MDDEIIGLPEIARICAVAPATARKWMERSVLPAPAGILGRQAYWYRSDIDRWRAIDRPVGRPRGSTRRKTSR